MTSRPQPRVTRRPQSEPPEEHVLRAAMETEGLRPYRWSNGPGAVYGEHDHAYHKVLFVVRGSIRFAVMPGGQDWELQPGDRLDLPQHSRHSAYVGAQGVVCLEATR